MRYIGNKTAVLNEIDKLIDESGLNKEGLSFFDAFTGTASVAQHYKDRYRIIANDNLYFSYVIAEARLNAPTAMFDKLGFDPFEYFNEADASSHAGFVAENFAPELSERMYFSHENAQLIDYIRSTVDEWFAQNKITENERFYLIASLLESVSKVANVAGVYGAYLKTWDPRAIKKMKFIPIDDNPYVVRPADVYNDDVLEVIEKTHGDILYLDPPYTKNQYSVQYHLLETIARYDNPKLNGKTGARDMGKFSSMFSKSGYAEVAFEQLIANAKYKYIILSYSSDGIMSKEYIESVLKRYGKKETFKFKKFGYKRYNNRKSTNDENHLEYLFFIEKKEDVVYSSPLNFIGGKGDLVPFLKAHMPENINTFYDLFAGGFNVGINVTANKIVYNDINYKVKELLQFIANTDIAEFYKYVEKTIKALGLSKENKDAYINLRNKYNRKNKEDRDCRDLFLLIMFGFQQQIRFNGNLDYNNPVGQAGFNDKVLEKLISFSRAAKSKNVEFYAEDYESFFDSVTPDDFVYIDPPYLITLGSYNDGKRGFNGWSKNEEIRMLAFLKDLDKKNVKFMLSNVLTHKNKKNEILQAWIQENDFNVIAYDGKARGSRAEVIITNY
ncbi:MAG: Dam family site-specific DNA-(adenine-N6)-methyltransferase [Clostridiales bacterium]|nr:Dam family site-specific DNA-(adenine-N6)-methyltransferase [Clostridiales bacterium]